MAMDAATEPTELVPRGRHLLPLATMVVLAVGCMACALITRNCQPGPPLLTQQPVTRSGVPIVRVLLTREPVSVATISAGRWYLLVLDGRRISSSSRAMAKTELRLGRSGWIVKGREIGAGALVLSTKENSCVRYDKTSYRGQLHFIPTGDGTFNIVNYVDMESYLAGVLAKELYPSWLPATFGAQAIAARSFALYHRNTFGRTHDYDVGDDQSSQVYGGIDGETDKSWNAVRATHGQILTVGTPGSEQSFMTQFSSTCGGIVNGARVIRDASDIEPLRGGQVCRYCINSPQYRWEPATVTKTELYRALVGTYEEARKLGGVRTVRVKSQTSYGRMVWVEIIGTNGKPMTIRGEDLRLALLRKGAKMHNTLYSMNCRIRDIGDSLEFYDGRGFGHGVGMCQWGAQGLAEEGASSEQILQFYYPGSRATRVY